MDETTAEQDKKHESGKTRLKSIPHPSFPNLFLICYLVVSIKYAYIVIKSQKFLVIGSKRDRSL